VSFRPSKARPVSPVECSALDFEIVGDLTDVETVATSRRIRDLPRLRRLYGKAYWRKTKGSARIRLRNGQIRVRNPLV